ncbi:hypothetical protein [Motilibacter aurantiacus]|uniref:hypothetical protein n=1 Tax=Motilibacter aurantiacus TaxID=2714955 RepID=UPI001408C58F|nr:hypothetical protein [Motilibacter aurantiacus]NHC46458.1 hypothetical protein [Motilibacter aurantiacus]
MRTRLAGAVVGTLLASGLTLPAPASATTGATTPKVYDCPRERPTVKPRAFTLDCAEGWAGLDRMRYSSWDARAAQGRARFTVVLDPHWDDDCSCITGKETHYPVTVRFDQPKQRRGVLVYTRVSVTFGNSQLNRRFDHLKAWPVSQDSL